jgi:hypothetical protein
MPTPGGGGGQQQQPASFSQGGNPAAYQPTAQPYADTQYQTLLNNLYWPSLGSLNAVSSSTGGAGAAGWAYPYAQNAAYNIGANPYAQEGIGAAESLAQNFAPQLSSFGGGLLNAGQGLLNAGQQELGMAPQLFAAGADPQQALYDSSFNRITQAANAANASSGVAGPYAASTITDAQGNFENQWQNQQLQRMLQGAQGAGQALGAGGNAISQGTNIIGQAGPLEQAALALKMAPGQAYQGQQSAALNALPGAVNIGEGAFNESNSVLSNLANYLNLGRGASLASGNLGQLGFNQGAQSAAGLGQLAGLGSNFAFGSQGLSGALGLGPGGLLGQGGLDIFGGGAGSAASGDALASLFADAPSFALF